MDARALFTCLPAVMLAVASPAFAGDTARNSSEITAVGSPQSKHRWLSTWGPSRDGAYKARVYLADLDLNSDAGMAAARTRVTHATGDVCEMATADSDFPGYPATNRRACVAETQGQMLAKLEDAAVQVRAGRPVAMIGTF